MTRDFDDDRYRRRQHSLRIDRRIGVLSIVLLVLTVAYVGGGVAAQWKAIPTVRR